MNSKETLNKIYEYIMIDYDMGLMDNEETEALIKDYNIIKQDLERLEKLEKENQELKEKCKILEENQETVLTTLESSVQENVKLRQVIEILKDELEISFEDRTQEGNGYWVILQNWNGEEEVVINFNAPDNYELLKEVLEEK